MALRLLLVMAAGALAAAPHLPAPLCIASDTTQISCFAPRRYGGSTFELFGAGSREPLGRLVAEAGQHRARFVLNGTAAAFRCYRGRYRSFDGRTWWESELSAAVPLSASDAASCDPAPPSPTSWQLSGATGGHSGTPGTTDPTTLRAPLWQLPVALSVGALVGLVAVVAVWRGSRRCRGAARGDAVQSVAMGTAHAEGGS